MGYFSGNSSFKKTDAAHADVAARQVMLTSPRHLLSPLVCLGVRVSPFIYLTSNSYLCFETDYSLVSYPFHA
jgi:hypothetical protein